MSDNPRIGSNSGNELEDTRAGEYMTDRLTDAAIALIQNAGGAAILAHPHRNVPTRDPAAIDDLLADLRAKGLDGVEVDVSSTAPCSIGELACLLQPATP